MNKSQRLLRLITRREAILRDIRSPFTGKARHQAGVYKLGRIPVTLNYIHVYILIILWLGRLRPSVLDESSFLSLSLRRNLPRFLRRKLLPPRF